MKKTILAAVTASALLMPAAMTPALAQYNGFGSNGYNGHGGDHNNGGQWRGGDNNWDPSHDYRDDRRYRGHERRLGRNDQVYRGGDGRYYCKRNDGTVGTVIGAVGGGVLGNVIAGGHSRGVGTILGAIAGGVVGKSVDQNNAEVRCR